MANLNVNKVRGDVLMFLTIPSVQIRSSKVLLLMIRVVQRSQVPVLSTAIFPRICGCRRDSRGKTAHARGSKLTGTMKNNGAVKGAISTVAGEYTVPQGYHDRLWQGIY